jgi:hypothetical protein
MKVTPNCFICKWSGIRKGTYGGKETQVLICMAQAYKFACECYDNKLCKELFESSEEKRHR